MRKSLFVPLTAAAICVPAVPASAATIVTTVNGSSASTFLTLFNPAYGPLQSVTLEGTASGSATLHRQPFGDLSAVSTPVSTSGAITFGSASIPFGASGFQTFDAGATTGSVSLSGTIFALLTGADLSSFFTTPNMASASIQSAFPLLGLLGSSPQTSLNLRVTYTYDQNPNGPFPPGAVPEPATWAMMLLGFGAIGLSARTRRRKDAVA